MAQFNHQQDDTESAAQAIRFLAYFLSGLLVVIWLVSKCSGAEVTIGWNAPPNAAAENITAYRVYRVSSTPHVLLGVSDKTHLTVLAEPGDRLSVAAYNGIESDLSQPITIPGTPPIPPDDPTPAPVMVKIHVYQVTDLKTRKTLATLYVKKEDADFFQLGIETP